MLSMIRMSAVSDRFRRAEDRCVSTTDVAAENQPPLLAASPFVYVQDDKRRAEDMPGVVEGEVNAVGHRERADEARCR